MDLDLNFNRLLMEEFGSKTYVPENDLARIMYYLDCIFAIIQYEEEERNILTDYEHYYELTEEEKMLLCPCNIIKS